MNRRRECPHTLSFSLPRSPIGLRLFIVGSGDSCHCLDASLAAYALFIHWRDHASHTLLIHDTHSIVSPGENGRRRGSSQPGDKDERAMFALSIVRGTSSKGSFCEMWSWTCESGAVQTAGQTRLPSPLLQSWKSSPLGALNRDAGRTHSSHCA